MPKNGYSSARHSPSLDGDEAYLSSYWMPFTANRQFRQAPRILESARGMYYRSLDGRRILDATSGLWCVNAGHGRREIAEAIAAQTQKLDYAPAFQMGHQGAFDLAFQLADHLPGDLNHIFFSNSGSEAVETALKIALAYHRIRGEKNRTRFISRQRGYHGAGFGGLSVGGIEANKEAFGLFLPGVDHLPHTHAPEQNAFSRGQPAFGSHLAEALETLITRHGAEYIAGVIIEPVAGSTGVLIPPQGYLETIRRICNQHHLLLIFDEVITGFGRLAHPFASNAFGVIPDIMTLAKGLTNGAVPMGATAVNRHIYDSLTEIDTPLHTIELYHGYTYSGHPLACAAGLATLKIHQQEKLYEQAARMAPLFGEALYQLKGHRHIADIRHYGLMAGIELISRPDHPGARGFEVYKHCFDHNLLIRTTGDVIALSPPLILEQSHIETMIDSLTTALNAVA